MAIKHRMFAAAQQQYGTATSLCLQGEVWCCLSGQREINAAIAA
jgi:hypothetical protein